MSNIKTLKISVKIEIDGKVHEGQIDSEQLCCVEIMRALRNEKNPVLALEFLACIGGNNLYAPGANENLIEFFLGPLSPIK